jgi:[acyl-carrier-protein] S-malonyltransferase
MMEPAREELEATIEATTFATPSCPYIKMSQQRFSSPEEIKKT